MGTFARSRLAKEEHCAILANDCRCVNWNSSIGHSNQSEGYPQSESPQRRIGHLATHACITFDHRRAKCVTQNDGAHALLARKHTEPASLRVARKYAIAVALLEIETVDQRTVDRATICPPIGWQFHFGVDRKLWLAEQFGRKGAKSLYSDIDGRGRRSHDSQSDFTNQKVIFRSHLSQISIIRSQYSSELDRCAMTTIVRALCSRESCSIAWLISCSVRSSSDDVASSKKSTSACL